VTCSFLYLRRLCFSCLSAVYYLSASFGEYFAIKCVTFYLVQCLFLMCYCFRSLVLGGNVPPIPISKSVIGFLDDSFLKFQFYFLHLNFNPFGSLLLSLVEAMCLFCS
jgi:hypothetical protein